jgi:hypothetical protein
MTVAADDAAFGPAGPAHLDAIVANNVAMARETEGLELPAATIHKGVKAVLDGTHGAEVCGEGLGVGGLGGGWGLGGTRKGSSPDG